MAQIIHIDQILIYYDEPQLFVARDVVDTSYLCLLYADKEYIAVRLSNKRIEMLKRKEMDVRSAFVLPENEKEYFKVSYTEEGLTIEIEDRTVLEEGMLPEKYLFLDFREEDETILQEASTYKHPVIHLGFVDKENSHSIPVRELAPLLSQFQLFVSNVHGKLHGYAKRKDAELRIVNTSAASFNVHFMTDEELDLFGSSDIALTMEKIDRLLSCKTEEELLNIAEGLKGHAMNSYKGFLRTLLEGEFSIKLGWVKDGHSVGFRKAQGRSIKEWYDVLEKQTELGREIIEVEGELTSASINTGKWELTTDRGETIKGASIRMGIVDHLTMSRHYKIRCEEFLEQNATAKNPKVRLLALEVVDN